MPAVPSAMHDPHAGPSRRAFARLPNLPAVAA